MDLSIIEHFIPNLAKWLNVDPATALFLVIGISSACNLVSRKIPDDVTGWKGTVRDICGFLGLYASNRVTKGVSANDVIKSVVGIAPPPVIEEVKDLAAETGALIPEVVEVAPIVTNSFGRFAENYKEEGDEEVPDSGDGSFDPDRMHGGPGRS